MKLSKRTGLGRVAAYVSTALSEAGIEAVLTGGACATLYSRGAYRSTDLDFILRSSVGAARLDAVMQSIGFVRRGNHYVHPDTVFFVEFPAGPLGVGADIDIIPTVLKIGATDVAMLSRTDSCRDRLAAFYHWRDRQSLRAAVAIARDRRVDLESIRSWSEREGAAPDFAEFFAALRKARGLQRRRSARRKRLGRR